MKIMNLGSGPISFVELEMVKKVVNFLCWNLQLKKILKYFLCNYDEIANFLIPWYSSKRHFLFGLKKRKIRSDPWNQIITYPGWSEPGSGTLLETLEFSVCVGAIISVFIYIRQCIKERGLILINNCLLFSPHFPFSSLIINSILYRYSEQSVLADHYFPPLSSGGLREEFGCFTYWRLDPAHINLQDIEADSWLMPSFQSTYLWWE